VVVGLRFRYNIYYFIITIKEAVFKRTASFCL
jgi:hypothetical protein